MANVPLEALVLVAVVPSPRDLEIARVLGWYRIPYKKAPKTIAVDYLALYQTGSFPPDDAQQINWVAEVRGHELVTRAELLRDERDHPRAGELYFKLQLGPLQRLPQSIGAGGFTRLTFLYTTGERLMAATTLADLTVDRVEREILWKALRERGLTADRAYGETATDATPADFDLSILCELGTLGISVGRDADDDRRADDGSARLYIPERRVRETPDDVVNDIHQAVKRLGGQRRHQPGGH